MSVRGALTFQSCDRELIPDVGRNIARILSSGEEECAHATPKALQGPVKVAEVAFVFDKKN
jgi:hypothetical protein